jgi:hypothetical protein
VRPIQNKIKQTSKSAKPGPEKQKQKNTTKPKHKQTKMSSRLTINDPIVAVLAPYPGTAAAKQAWFRGLDSDARHAVIAKWLETFRFPGFADTQ